MAAQQEQRLFAAAELPALLQLRPEQIDRLLQTGQLPTIRICGEVRVTSHQIDSLIATYSQIAKRKEHAEVLQ